MAPEQGGVDRPLSTAGSAVLRGAFWTVFYYLLAAAVLVYWQGSGGQGYYGSEELVTVLCMEALCRHRAAAAGQAFAA